MIHRIWGFGALLLALNLTAEARDCSQLTKSATSALEQLDIIELRTIYAESQDCSPELRDWSARLLATGLWREFRQQGATAPENFRSQLEEAAALGSMWQAHATLGDLSFAKDDYAQSLHHYKAALDLINDTGKTPQAPPESVIGQISGKAQQAQILTPKYSSSAGARGPLTGLEAASVRSFKLKKRSLPVEFLTDSTDFTPKGYQAALDLARELKNKKSPSVTLIGHSDERGEADYNLALSTNRAEALKDFLEQQGVTANITARGEGESAPPIYYNEELLDANERWQIARRVEIRFED